VQSETENIIKWRVVTSGGWSDGGREGASNKCQTHKPFIDLLQREVGNSAGQPLP